MSAPDATLDTLMGLSVTGEADGRIAAARQRIARLQPRNDFAGRRAFSAMTPERALESAAFPPRSPKENAFRGLAAVDLVIQDVLAKGPGDLPNAMRRADLPGGQQGITFRWGTPGEGTDFKGGSGLSHIIAKHGIESVEEVVVTITSAACEKQPHAP